MLQGKERTKESLKEKRGIDIDTARVSIRIQFGDKTSKLARESLNDLKEQGVALVNLGSDRYVPATNITGAEAFSKEDADRLKGGPSFHRQRQSRSWSAVPRRWKPYRPTATTRGRWPNRLKGWTSYPAGDPPSRVLKSLNLLQIWRPLGGLEFVRKMRYISYI